MSTPKILVVDDEPAVLGLVSKALSAKGYEVHAACHPNQALKLAEAMPCFDLVVSDVIMPDRDVRAGACQKDHQDLPYHCCCHDVGVHCDRGNPQVRGVHRQAVPRHGSMLSRGQRAGSAGR